MSTELMGRGDFSTISNHTPKRILILMSNTGGGHRAATEAIAEALHHLYGPDASVVVVDAWQHHVAWPVNKIGKSYGWVVNRATWVWKALWLLEHKPKVFDTFMKSIYPLAGPGLLKLFNLYRPDVIVSVHPLITQIPLEVLKRANSSVPFITVVTDMAKGYHTWYDSRTTLCLTPTEAARQQALVYGLDPTQVVVAGQPVALIFAAKPKNDKQELRRKLGLNLDKSTILLAGGGEGFGPIFNIARNISQNVPPVQLVIVAGRNQSLRENLEEVTWEIPTKIFGFVDNMPELMGAADVFVTKAGPGCIAEAFVAGLPLILFDYIPGQEEANVDYVVKHNAGAYVADPEKIATLLSEWLIPNNSKLARMTQNAASLSHPEAALTISHHIYNQASIYQRTSARNQWPKPRSGSTGKHGVGTDPDSRTSPNPAASANA